MSLVLIWAWSQLYIIVGTAIATGLANYRVIEIPNAITLIAAVMTWPLIVLILGIKFCVRLFRESYNFYKRFF